jgi:phosphatidylglycerophosphate synthase
VTSEVRQTQTQTVDPPRALTGATGVAAAPRRRTAAPVAAAVVLATAPARDGGGPAALLPWEDGTVLSRLLGQLSGLGVREAHVLTRPAWRGAVEAEAERAGGAVRVHAAGAVDGDLRRIAELSAQGGGALVVLYGDIVTHREALAGLLADPRIATGILAGGGATARPFAFRVRGRRGRLVSAASPYHAVFRPTASFLGVLKVGPGDRAALADAAERVAAVTRELPPAWRDELDRKARMWRYALYRAAHGEQYSDADGDADGPGPEADALGEDDGGEADALPASGALELSDEDEARLRERTAAAPDDAVAMLLVGMIRSGAHVSLSHLRALYWARTLSAGAVDSARHEITGYDEDRVLLDSAVKASDGFFTTFFVSPYSRYLARWAARRGFTPNQVTTVSVLIGVLAAAAFATGERWGLIAGAVLLQAAFTTDCVDGQLARYTRQFSKLGAWLDSVFDRTKEYAAFAGLAIGASRAGDPVWLLACSALALQSVRHMADFSYGAGQQQVIGATGQPPVEQSGDTWSVAADARRAARRAEIEAAAAAGRAPAELPETAAPAAPGDRVHGLLRGVLSAWHVVDRLGAVRWLKKMIAFPIGERFAAISLTAALFTPRVTFVVLLAWGGFASLYTLAGRVLRSVVR